MGKFEQIVSKISTRGANVISRKWGWNSPICMKFEYFVDLEEKIRISDDDSRVVCSFEKIR